MFFLLLLDFIIYITIIVTLHLILKKYLNNIESYALYNTKNNNETEVTKENNNDINDDEEVSWDEISVEKNLSEQIITESVDTPDVDNSSKHTKNIDNNLNYSDALFRLNDRQLFNNTDKNSKTKYMHGANELWAQNNKMSELLQNHSPNELEQQYSSYWNDIKDQNITTQSYDNIVNLRNKESETYFHSNKKTNIDIKDINKQYLQNINNNTNNLSESNNTNENSSSDITNDKINTDNTLDYTSLNNNSIYDKDVIQNQYNTLKIPKNVDSFLKQETNDVDLNNKDSKVNTQHKIQKENIELSDVRNTFAINNNSSLINSSQNIEAFENHDNMSSL